MLFIHDPSLAASKKNLVKIKFPWIDIFDHEVHVMINVIHDLTVVVFENLYITSNFDFDLRIKYTERILGNSDPKNTDRSFLSARRKIGVCMVISGLSGCVAVLRLVQSRRERL